MQTQMKMSKLPCDKSPPSSPQATTSGNAEAKPVKFVVIRDGHRVSDNEYDSPTDPVCVNELKLWYGISKNHSHGEKVEAVQYDSKIHRIW